MDLSKIRSSLPHYSSLSILFSDLSLIWSNCKLFNQKNSAVYKQAVAMEGQCKELFKEGFAGRWEEIARRAKEIGEQRREKVVEKYFEEEEEEEEESQDGEKEQEKEGKEGK
jgi:hypothetical protein